MRNGKLAAGIGGVIAVGAAAVAVAQIPNGVPDANDRTGAPLNLVAKGFTESPVVSGEDPLENPQGIITRYGYLNDQLSLADGGSGEATRTEADGNSYLVASNLGGPTAGYNYGQHYVFTSHENGRNNKGANATQAYITRVNLDVKDEAHRVTLLTYPDGENSTGLTRIDGNVYNPFSSEVLGAQEGNGSTGGIVGVKVRWTSTSPPPVQTYYGSMGRGGYEGIHPDSKGNLIIAEDVGGSGVTDPDPAQGGNNKVRAPNSFMFRFIPDDPSDLSKGELQVLQVRIDGTPQVFHGTGGCADGSGKTLVDDTFGPEIAKLHDGTKYNVKWISIHDTSVDGTAAFDSNALAKVKCGTPFKRPENWAYVPGTGFRSLVFDETGDTNADAGHNPNGAARGAWGTLYRLDFPSEGASTGTIRALVNGDETHNSFDTLTFLNANTLLTGEDRGETLHSQLNKLDSLWSFDIRQPLADINADAKRLVALGRDPASQANAGHLPPDSGSSTSPSSFQNDGDNEVTGVIVSDGFASKGNVWGKEAPTASARIFYTQQHGENTMFELKR